MELWHPWSDVTGSAFQALVAEFNDQNEFGISVEAIPQGNYDELYEKVNVSIISNQLPDLVVGYSYQVRTWQAIGANIVDLNPYLQDFYWGMSSSDQGDYYPAIWEQDVVNEVRLGMPALRSAQVLFYNISWAQELGYESPPYTPMEFKEQACAAAQANRFDADPGNDGTGGWIPNTSPVEVLSWFYAFGSQVIDSSGEGYRFATSQTENALVYLKDLYDSGCIWITSGEYSEKEFVDRQALFISSSVADIDNMQEVFDLGKSQDIWTVIGFPTPERQPLVTVYGPAIAMFDANQETNLASWIFLRWLLAPQNQARWIQASGSLPLRRATSQYLSEYIISHPQWAATQALLEQARPEPNIPSWKLVKWVVSDVGVQVFRSYYEATRIPETLKLLDKTVNELHLRFP